MKTIKYTLAALVLMGLTLTSCDKSPLGGSAIRFSATTNTETKASYSGERSGGKERIDWTKGDLIRICCEQSMTPDCHYADYVVGEDISSKDATSSTKIEPDGDALWWSNGDAPEFYFYAIYPSPSTTGKSGDSFSVDGKLEGGVPSAQKPVGLGAGSDVTYYAKPDLTSQYMAASLKTDFQTGIVGLQFKPFVTAVDFIIQNDYSNGGDMLLKSVALASAANDIAGRFTTDLATWSGTYPDCAEKGEGTKTVSIDFSPLDAKGYLTIKKGETLKFTFFLLPTNDLDDLTFKVTRSDGSTIKTKLAYHDDTEHGNEGILFPCHKKTYVKGILVPEGAMWYIKYDASLESWDDVNGGEKKFDGGVSTGENAFLTKWQDEDGVDIYMNLTN